MDIKAPWPKYDLLSGISCDIKALQQSVDLIATSGVDHQFRTTQAHHLLGESDDLLRRLVEPTAVLDPANTGRGAPLPTSGRGGGS